MALPGYDKIDPYGLEMSGLPPEMRAEARALRNRERVAQEMLAAGMAPLGGARSAGRYMVAPSWAEGAARLANTAVGSMMERKAEQGYRGLGERQAQIEAQAVQDYQRRKYGTPQAPLAPATPNDDEGNPMPAAQMPNVGADPRGAVESAILSRFPALQKLGALDLSNLNRTEDREDTQAYRTAEAKAAREQRAADAAEADKRRAAEAALARSENAANREAMLRTAASLRTPPQPQQPKVIETPTGPMILNADGTTKPVLGPDNKPLGPKKAGAPLSATAQKELFEADDVANSAATATSILKSIITPDPKTGKSQNDLAYEGGTAEARRAAMSFVPGSYEGENAAVDLKNKVTGQALEQLKVIFGGMPTEGERKILIELQGSINQKAEQRKAIFERAIALAERRQKLAQDKAKKLREGTYFGAGTATNQDGNQAPGEWAIVR